MKQLSLISIFLILLFTACQDDDNGGSAGAAGGQDDPIVNYSNPQLSGVNVQADFRGRVTSRTGEPVAAATVTIGNKSTQTSTAGFYQIDNANVDARFALIKVNGANFFSQQRNLIPRTSSVNYEDIALVEQTFASISAASGGQVALPDGGTISFPADAFATEDGSAVTGEIFVAHAYLDPTDPMIALYLPGGLAAVDSAGTQTSLTTYGMIGVELFSNSGNAVVLAEGKKATLEFPVQAEQMSHAPAEISLWFFDEASGIWREEGLAVQQGLSYVADVSHFTFWNCDVPSDFIQLNGIIEVSGAQPGSGYVVQIIRENGASAFDQVGADGSFGGAVPLNEVLTMNLLTVQCDAVSIYSQEIGPFSVDTDLGIIDVLLSGGQEILVLSGQVVDCDGVPIQNTLVNSNYIFEPGGYAFTDENGAFEFGVPCQTTGDASVTIIDIETSTSVTTDGFPFNTAVSTALDMGQLTFCDAAELTTYLIVDDGMYAFTYPVLTVSVDSIECFIFSASEPSEESNLMYFGFSDAETGGNSESCISAYVEFITPNGDQYFAELNDMEYTIDTFDNTADILIEGSFTAFAEVEIVNPVSGNQISTYSAPLTGQFRYEP